MAILGREWIQSKNAPPYRDKEKGMRLCLSGRRQNKKLKFHNFQLASEFGAIFCKINEVK
jgi:hypothetical protein